MGCSSSRGFSRIRGLCRLLLVLRPSSQIKLEFELDVEVEGEV